MAKANETKGFEHIHYFLIDALRTLDRGRWPARFHCDGPLPVLTYDAQPRVARVIATHARAHAEDPGSCDRLLKIVETTGAGVKREALDKATKATKSDEPALQIVRLCARSVFNYRHASQSAKNVIGKGITAAVTAYAQHFADARALLEDVDAAIVREELRDKLVDKKVRTSSPLVRVLSRPRAGKSFALLLAELEQGYGIWVKLKNSWQWHEGDRATVFATVPDAYMDRVAADLG